ncbi:hypothetical protein G7B40_025750 [Aetokthonos hydrillicola Thurmond2011]|jgi:glucan phosphoethanolaminetransferase (alkaline phosphatase superfamily)|uniref:Uncharacterized protein n=1 Tax=Aetokthonos hydrillicola Thurmond2011 TaxID=2712845 RepID=A0AAP5IAI6_9CYAN|nr:hypothetical protein [Aetokthonos hydrillicola]MBO3460679.1 hypothetical protein [Aetokthonos hydrillicola CCALA 1050]MBW4587677.1 hypothetical protein [Aetokthonos hydrillicola CCALA 1050]MDR9897940.1 hypothetical protein [Aetokthonos hydrillicola Thurmond2011]
MENLLFWASWLVSLGITALLVFWSLPLSPFTHPGTTANEAAIIFLLVMVIRWGALATALALAIIAWWRRLDLVIHWIIGLSIGALVLHFLLGIINLGVMNAWLSVDQNKTRAINTVYAVIYFAVPTLVLLLTASLKLSVTHFPQ